MSLFDKEFFPTPKEIAIHMVRPYLERLGCARILEPSAGNGAILDAITEDIPYIYENEIGKKYELTTKARDENIFCIEMNPELQMILQQKRYRLLASDFLTYTPDHDFDLLIMNPPFAQGDQHLLHAWEILREGDIACLLNAETIRNPYTKTRKLLASIIAEHGSVEELGRCFHNADNATDVEVALVRLHKEDTHGSVFDLGAEGFKQEQAPSLAQETTSSGQGLAQSNQLDAYLRAWALTKDYAVDFIKSYQKLYLYLSAFLGSQVADNRHKDTGKDIITTAVNALAEHNDAKGAQRAYEGFIDEAKARAWNTIISSMGLEKYMTSTMRETMKRFREAQGSFELNKENIMKLFQLLMANIGNIMKSNIVSVYDTFTRYFDGNTSCTEGWKTNKQYRANKKIILPNIADAGFMPDKYGYDEYFDTHWHADQTLQDIDKAMCWLSGTSYDTLDEEPVKNDTQLENLKEQGERMTISAVLKSIPVGNQDWHESAFFLVKAFKKGTVHLQFRNEDLLNKFNITVNEGKNELGAGENA